MKYITVLFILIFVVGCSENVNQPEGHSQVVTKIDTPELIEAFITYVHKAEKPEVDKSDEMRNELQAAGDVPLLAPYIVRGTGINRIHLMDQIGKAKAKWEDSDMPMDKTALYASEKSNLQKLSDAELVIALRLMNQVVSNLK